MLSCWDRFENFLWEGKPDFSDMNESYIISRTKLHVVRVILMFYTVAIYIWSQVEQRSFEYNFRYLTHWGIDFVMVYFLCMTIEMIFFYRNNCQQYFFHFSKFNTILFVFGFSAELTIFILFWFGVYPNSKDEYYGVALFKTLNDHGGFLLAVWIENSLNAIKFKKRHLIILLLIIFLYIMTNVGVTFYNDKPVYAVLKYTDGKSYGYLAAAIIIAVIHFYGNIYFYNKVKAPRLTGRTTQIPVSVPRKIEMKEKAEEEHLNNT